MELFEEIRRGYAAGETIKGLAKQHGVHRRMVLANHESPRTTKLYDRRQDEISLDEVEKILI